MDILYGWETVRKHFLPGKVPVPSRAPQKEQSVPQKNWFLWNGWPYFDDHSVLMGTLPLSPVWVAGELPIILCVHVVRLSIQTTRVPTWVHCGTFKLVVTLFQVTILGITDTSRAQFHGPGDANLEGQPCVALHPIRD